MTDRDLAIEVTRTAAHTPGPWKFHEVSTSINVRGPRGLVAGMAISPRSGIADEGRANARLIAACPAMIERIERNTSDLLFLRQAIAAGDPTPELLVRVSDLLRDNQEVLAKATGAASD